MSWNNNNNTGFTVPLAPMGYGYGNGGGFGGLGGDFLALAFLLFPMMFLFGGFGGGFGGFGGGNNLYPWLNQADQISGGFANQANGIALNGIQANLGDISTQLCGGFAGVNATVNNAENLLSQQMYNNQIAELQQGFALQQAMNQGFNAAQAQLAQCCCDNRLATCQTQNIVQTEGAATRAATQAVGQAILDKMCQDKIDAKNEKIVEQAARINALEANNYVQNAITAQTQYLLDRLPPTTPATAASGT